MLVSKAKRDYSEEGIGFVTKERSGFSVVTVEVRFKNGAFVCQHREPSKAKVRLFASTYEVALKMATKLLKQQGVEEFEFVRV